MITLSKLLMTSCLLQDKVKTPFHGIQMAPSYLGDGTGMTGNLVPSPNILSYTSVSVIITKYSRVRSHFHAPKLCLYYFLLLCLIKVYFWSWSDTLFSLEQTPPPRQGNISPLCPSVTWHVSPLTGCGRSGELHL